MTAAFYIYFRTHIKGLQWLATPPPHSDSNCPVRRRALFDRMMNTLSVSRWGDCKDARDFLHGWFLGKVDDVTTLRRGNVEQWFAWAVFYKFPSQLTDAERIELQHLVDRFEAKTKITFAPGFDPSQVSMRLSLDPMSAIHRPLMVYCAVALFNSCSKIMLTFLLKFTRRRIGGFHYWYKPHKPTCNANGNMNRRKLPLVFVHGLGQGLINYLHFISHITDRDVFLVELSHISTRVWEHVPGAVEVVCFVQALLQEHNYARAIFAGHSFGTITIAWLIRYRPELVYSALIIDPVTLMLCLPLTCYTFVYKPPRDVMDWVRYLTVGQEMGISRVMKRNFWWQENVLFLEDLPHHMPVPDSEDRTAFYSSVSSRARLGHHAAYDAITLTKDQPAGAAAAAGGASFGSGEEKEELESYDSHRPHYEGGNVHQLSTSSSIASSTGGDSFEFVPLPGEVDVYGIFDSPNLPHPEDSPFHASSLTSAFPGSSPPGTPSLTPTKAPSANKVFENPFASLSPLSPISPLSSLAPLIETTAEAFDQIALRLRRGLHVDDVSNYVQDALGISKRLDQLPGAMSSSLAVPAVTRQGRSASGALIRGVDVVAPTTTRGAAAAAVANDLLTAASRMKATAVPVPARGESSSASDANNSIFPQIVVTPASSSSSATSSSGVATVLASNSVEPTRMTRRSTRRTTDATEAAIAAASAPKPSSSSKSSARSSRSSSRGRGPKAGKSAAPVCALDALAQLGEQDILDNDAVSAAHAHRHYDPLHPPPHHCSLDTEAAAEGVDLTPLPLPTPVATRSRSGTTLRQMKLGVFLGGKDDLVPSVQIVRHFRAWYAHQLKGRQATFEDVRTRVLYEPDHIHGTMLFNGQTRTNILSLLPWLEED